MTVIRLTRMGKKKKPFYRIVVTDSRKRRDGGWKEVLGHYNPVNDEKSFKLDKQRYDYWVQIGAKPSEAVKKLAKRV
jgi:small subunit ribosomal protein S16